jgi:hypothetical protein
MRNKAPCLPAILIAMAMAMRRCNTSASPDVACPGLLQKPLDAAIEQLLTMYCPGGRQGDNQQNNNAKYTYFAGRFDGHHDAPVRYREYCPMEEVCGFQRSH